MTIKFNCPNCGALIAFDSKYCGKRAHCTACGQVFIIPSRDNEIPQKIERQTEKAEPIPGFYRAVFIDGWKIFIDPENATGLVFVVAAVCFKFFTGHLDYSFPIGPAIIPLPVGFIISIVAWGCLFWYYMEIIYSTAFDVEKLPDVDMGGLLGFLWNIIKSLYIFSMALVLVELPCIISIVICRKMGTQCPALSHILALVGLFAFPMAILTVSVGRDITMLLQPNHIVLPIVKALLPYLVAAGLLALAGSLQLNTTGLGRLLQSSKLIVGLHLAANLAVQAIVIIAMRSIGLLYRHYSCHFPW